MAYTTAQLVTLYTNANLGKGPDAATTLTLDAYASQTQTGGLTDATALTNTLKLVNNTTAVAVETYQFFTGHAPSAAGLAYLVNSTTNTADLNDAYFAKFGQENRFINFSINLATGSGEGAAAFAASYTGVSYAQTVATAYDKIIGNEAAKAAGVDVSASVAFFSRQANIDYLTAFVKANTNLTSATDIDLAVKAALIGEILNAATVSGIGGYAKSTAALIADLSDGTLSTDNAAGVNILTAYPNTQPSVTTALTASIDAFVGTSANDTINGIVGGGVSTLTAADSIDGGAGNDTLNIVDIGGGFTTAIPGLKITNVETVNVTSVAGATIDSTPWNGVVTLNTNTAGATSVTANNTTAVVSSVTSQAATAVAANGGASLSLTTAGNTGGTTIVGATAAVSGPVSVSVAGAYADAGAVTMGNTTVTGGTTVSVTQNSGITAAQNTSALIDGSNTKVTQGTVSVNGNASTTAVTVSQQGPAASANYVAAVAATSETASLAFGAGGLTAGQTLTIAGLTYTSTGVTTQAQLAAAFANLAAGATTGAGVATGAYSGALTGYSTGAAATNTVVATSTTTGDVANLTPAGTGAGAVAATITNGTSATTGVDGVVGVDAGNVQIVDAKASTATAGTITTVTLTNSAGATIADNSLSTLNLAGDVGVVVVNASAAATTAGTAATTLNLNLTGTLSAAAAVSTVASSVTGAQYTTLNVASTAASTIVLTTANATALNVSGTAVTTVGATSNLSALKTIAVTGSAGLSGTFTAGTLTSISTAGTTGNSSITMDGTVATFTGGAGNDTVTISAAPTKAISGGAGTDVLVANIAGGFNASGNANITGFETLQLGTAATGTFDATGFTALRTSTIAAAAGFSNVAAGVGLTQTASAGFAVTVALADASGTNDAFTWNLSSSGAIANTLNIANVENITINAADTNSTRHVDTLVLNDIAVKAVTITGSAGVNLTTTGAVDLVSVNASANTGGLVYTSTATTGPVTLIGSATNVNTLTTGATVDTITGGSKADVISSGAGLDIVTGGAGNDTFIFTANANGNTYTTVTDFAKGDTLDFSALVKNGGVATDYAFVSADKISLADTAAFADYLNASTAFATAGTTSVVSWFVYSGNTYIVVDNNNDTTFQNNAATGDQVIKLTGVFDLNGQVINGGGLVGHLTLA